MNDLENINIILYYNCFQGDYFTSKCKSENTCFKMIVLQSTIQPFTNISCQIKRIKVRKEERKMPNKIQTSNKKRTKSVICRYDQRAFKGDSHANTTSKR